MADSAEAIVNQALILIGYKGRIGSFYDGTPASVAATEVYAQTRDELMDAGEWPLARRANIALTLLKGPPPPGGFTPTTPWSAQYPPPGWLYEYAYPDDMLDLRAIIPPPQMMFDLTPRPSTWRVDNDNSLVTNTGAVTVQKKVILTNTKGALATYIATVTDPNLWEPGFTSIMIDALSKKLARKLIGGQGGEEITKAEMAETEYDWGPAERARG